VQQFDEKKFKPPAPSWYDLKQLPRSSDSDGEGDVWETGTEDDSTSSGARYSCASTTMRPTCHVLDEAAPYASDFEPSALPLRSQAIGVLELAILRATSLRSTKRPNGGRGTVDAYCIAMGSGWAWVGHGKGQRPSSDPKQN
jgi:hypothetical protein